MVVEWLRWRSVQHSTACFSIQKGPKEQARNILQRVDHRMSATEFDREHNAVVKLANPEERVLFIPAGFESQDEQKKVRQAASASGNPYA